MRPTVRPFPCSPKDDDQYRYQDQQQVVKLELKCRIKALEANELTDQSHPLFIGKVLNREAGYEHREVGNHARYIEKHLEPPLISLNYQYAGGCRPPYSSGVCGAAARRAAKGLLFPYLKWIRRGRRRLRQEGGICMTLAGYVSAR
jgi:hypothetical protein